MIKAVIFDLDGTILDTLSTIAYFGNLALKTFGFPTVDEKEFKYFAGDGKKVLLHRMLDFINEDTEENFTKVEKKYDYEYEKDTMHDTKPFPGICEMLNTLKARGIKLAVLSNKPDNVTCDVVKKIFGETFDHCQGKINGVPAKPDPLSVISILDKLNVKNDECVFVGDTNVDIITAKNADLVSIGVLWGFRDYDELKNADADYIIDNPEEISKIILKIENEI